MKRLTLLLLLLVAGAPALRAQSLASFKERLAQTETTADQIPARVQVLEWGDAGAAVRMRRNRRDASAFGVIASAFSSTTANHARSRAVAARAAFEEAFPDVRVYMVYENPYFKVTAGNCVTSEEAIVLLGRVRSRFPGAYLMREEMSVADLVR